MECEPTLTTVRIDRVTLVRALGFKKVVSLVLTVEGLYIIRTGNVGGLPKKERIVHSGGLANEIAAGAVVKRFENELAKGEAALEEVPLQELAGRRGSFFVPSREIISVFWRETAPPMLVLTGAHATFRLAFGHSSPVEIQGFQEALDALVIPDFV